MQHHRFSPQVDGRAEEPFFARLTINHYLSLQEQEAHTVQIEKGPTTRTVVCMTTFFKFCFLSFLHNVMVHNRILL